MKAQTKLFLKRMLFFLLGLNHNFLRAPREDFGNFPYPRRSPILLLVFNFMELKSFLFSRNHYRVFRKATKKLQNSKKGKTALILGNGPSLNKLDSEQVNFDNPDVWVVNNFYRTSMASDLRVSHYVFSDPLHIQEPAPEFVEWINSRISRKLNIVFVLPHWSKSSSLNEFFPDQVTYYFDDRSLSSWTSNTSPLKPRGYISLTLYKALAFAIYLGYERIYILGMDNTEFLSLTSNAENRIINMGQHAYARSSTDQIDLTSEFQDGFASAFLAYAHAFGDLLKFKGPIVNLDKKSLTTAFPKISNHPWVKP